MTTVERIDWRAEQLGLVEGSTIIARIGVPPSTKTLKERFDLVFHPDNHPYQEIEVTVDQLREIYNKKQIGEELSVQESEILFAGILALGVAVLNSN